jgi:hypothetical protein
MDGKAALRIILLMALYIDNSLEVSEKEMGYLLVKISSLSKFYHLESDRMRASYVNDNKLQP